MVSAMGGESHPVNESASARTKIIFARVGIDWKKSIRRKAFRASECALILGVSPETWRLGAVTERVHLLAREELQTWTSREWDALGWRQF